MNSSNSPALGLSIGSATLAAVTRDCAVTGPPAVTRAGWLIDDFVNRVGDPVGIVAPDGSVHTGAALLADALSDLARSALPGWPAPAAVTVAHPAHWRPAAVDAMGRALRRIPGWSFVRLVPDYAAALTALRDDPALPGRGVVAICDLGATGTTLTLIDAGNGMALIGEPVRYPDFSGEAIDRALLTHVLSAAGVAPGSTGTSALKALTRLRDECRQAKERLSALTATTVPGQLAGVRGDIRITRPELDAIIREQLTGVVDTLREILSRNGIAPGDLVAVASAGGMAAVPAVTTTLSEHLRVPVITARRPALSAATGAARQAGRSSADEGATVVTPVRREPESQAPAALAWSQARDVPEFVPQRSSRRRPDPRPKLDFMREPVAADSRPPAWYRQPLVLAAAVVAIVAGAGAATALALHADATSVPVRPPANAGPNEPVAPPSPTEAPRTVVALPGPASQQPPQPAVTETVLAAPPPRPEVPAPAAEAVPAAEPPPVVEATPATESAPVPQVATEASAPPPLVIPTIPPLPPIPLPPIPLPSIPGLPPLFVPPSG